MLSIVPPLLKSCESLLSCILARALIGSSASAWSIKLWSIAGFGTRVGALINQHVSQSEVLVVLDPEQSGFAEGELIPMIMLPGKLADVSPPRRSA